MRAPPHRERGPRQDAPHPELFNYDTDENTHSRAEFNRNTGTIRAVRHFEGDGAVVCEEAAPCHRQHNLRHDEPAPHASFASEMARSAFGQFGHQVSSLYRLYRLNAYEVDVEPVVEVVKVRAL